MKILVLGAGGIGGYFGGRLAQAGADVTFLVRPKRREQIQRDGLRIESPLGDAKLAVKTVLAEELKPGYGLVIFTCKAYDLDSAMDAIAPAMDGNCAVAPQLNGIAHLEKLDRRFGRSQVMGGVAQINVTLRRDGVVHHMDKLGRIVFGERDKRPSARSQALGEAFAKTNVDWKLSPDIELEMWEKIVFLSALAATTCLSGRTWARSSPRPAASKRWSGCSRPTWRSPRARAIRRGPGRSSSRASGSPTPRARGAPR